MATKKKDTAITTPGSQEIEAYPILSPVECANALDVINENLGDAGVQISALTKVTAPPGGGVAFTIQTEEGPKAETILTGIIILAPQQNAFWPESIEAAPSAPPACFSHDGQQGTGDPLGRGQVGTFACATCPKKAWGSDPKGGRGKACKDLRPLFLLLPGEYLPIIVQVSPMSLKHVSGYFTMLARKGIPYYRAITTIGLNQTKNSAGVVFSELTFAFTGLVDKAHTAAIKQYQEALRAQATQPPQAADMQPTKSDDQIPGDHPEDGTIGDAEDYDPFGTEANDGDEAALLPNQTCH